MKKQKIISMGLAALMATAALFSVQAATYTNFVGSVGYGYPGLYAARDYTLKATVTNLVGYTTGDVIQVFGVTSGTVVKAVGYHVKAVTTNAATIDIGDGDTQAGFLDDVALSSVGYGSSLASATTPLTAGTISLTGGSVAVVWTSAVPVRAYQWGKLYTVNDTIDLRVNQTPQYGTTNPTPVAVDFWAIVSDGVTD